MSETVQSNIGRVSQLAMKISGINVSERRLEHIQLLISGFTLFALSLLTMIQVIINVRDSSLIEDDTIQGIMATTALNVTFMKLVQVVKKRNQVFDLYESFEINLSKHSAQLELLEEKGTFSLIKIQLACSFGSVLFAFLQSNVISMNIDNSKPLYPITVPEDKHEKSSLFYGIVFLQVFGGAIFAAVNTGTLALFAHTVHFVCCQLKLLSDKLNDDAVKNRVSSTWEGKAEYNKNIRFHIHLLHIVDQLQSVFSTIIFAEFLSSQFLSCILVTITIKKMRSGLILQALQHISLIPTLLLVSFTFFYLGDKLIHASIEARTGVYFSKWYGQGNMFNKMLCIVLERMKKPMTMWAASVIPVSLNSFLKVIQAGYSYFNFLDAMYRRRQL